MTEKKSLRSLLGGAVPQAAAYPQGGQTKGRTPTPARVPSTTPKTPPPGGSGQAKAEN